VTHAERATACRVRAGLYVARRSHDDVTGSPAIGPRTLLGDHLTIEVFPLAT
jgi:hypothetical protein